MAELRQPKRSAGVVRSDRHTTWRETATVLFSAPRGVRCQGGTDETVERRAEARHSGAFQPRRVAPGIVTSFDLVVVGGGITGLGVARLAARNGLTVAVLERSDLASGASSCTSHMLHGGLRYLERGHFALVREALSERAAVSRLAPAFVRPTRFLIPLRRGDRRLPWKLRLGLAAYDLFAGRAGLAPHAMVRRAEALRLEPELRSKGLAGAGLYSDTVMDDAALAVAVARDAAAHGAQIWTYTEAIGARPVEDGVEMLARDTLEGGERRIRGRAVVNAAGAWADGVRTTLLRALTPGAVDPAPLLRPSRGIHLVFPPLTRGHALLFFAGADDRVLFVVPFGPRSLVGTTEVETPSPPTTDAREPSTEEVRYLRHALARILPGPAEQPPLAVTAGLRPLLASTDPVGSASREHRVIADGPLVTIVGGKYTTFRVMARDTLACVVRRLGKDNLALRDPMAPLPAPVAGASIESLAEWAVDAFARRIEDVVRRRSALWLEPDRGRLAAPRVGAVLARRLGWSPSRLREELDSFHGALEREERFLRAAREDP